MKIAFLGATKGMGRALSRLMAERGDRLFLLGRDAAELDKAAADLKVYGSGVEVGTVRCDLLDAATLEPALDRAEAALGGFDCVVVTAGMFAAQEELENDAELCARLLTANFTNTIQLCEAARKRMLARGGGTLVVFSSVAGDRARKPVILYGASKAGLSYYLNGLDHKFRAQGLKTVLVKPGFVKTGMTAGLKAPPFAGEPDDVARAVLKAIDAGQAQVYAPPIWQLVMLVIRSLPRAAMRKIGF